MSDDRDRALPFEISLAQWSLHRTIFAGELDPLDFPRHAAEAFGINAVEYVNRCFKDRADYDSLGFIDELKKRSDDAGVRNLVIMIDREGDLGDSDELQRGRAVDNHLKYLDAAMTLGCHAIRVNARSAGSRDEQMRLAADGLRHLGERAEPYDIRVLVENHGGWSSDGAWLADVMKQADHPLVGTLPDFGNFCLDWERRDDPTAWYDRYRGVSELMPFAGAVSAKSNDFNDTGEEIHTDYERMIAIVLGAGYRSAIGIEYEGEALPEAEGIRRTKALLERVGRAWADGRPGFDQPPTAGNALT